MSRCNDFLDDERGAVRAGRHRDRREFRTAASVRARAGRARDTGPRDHRLRG